MHFINYNSRVVIQLSDQIKHNTKIFDFKKKKGNC